MQKIAIIAVVVVLLGGGVWWWLSSQADSADPANPAATRQMLPSTETRGTTPLLEGESPAASGKVGTTTKMGMISSDGSRFYLTEAGAAPQEVDSMMVDLSAYVGQTVTVSGQYSGDTLFVGSVE
jgi:hypothetical protein